MDMHVENLKQLVMERIDKAEDELVSLSQNLQANPEIAFQEHQACTWITDTLKRNGFIVESGVANLPTAFVASISGNQDGPTIGIIAEYDALPSVGHGCGHNLIASGAVGAALGSASAISSLPGTIKVFGTPAEEYTDGRAGKLLMLEAGVFDGVDACLFFHPLTRTIAPRTDLGFIIFDAVFHGQTAHAAADPWNGCNALDGVFLAYAGLSALRQQIQPDARIHAIVTKGGDAVNIIPEIASIRVMFRSPDHSYIEELSESIEQVLLGASKSSRTQLDLNLVTKIQNVKFNSSLFRTVRDNLESIDVQLTEEDFLAISGDIGNVSQALPTFYFTIQTHPQGVNWHSREVARGAISPRAHEAMLQAAMGIGMSVVDLLANPRLINDIRQEFANK